MRTIVVGLVCVAIGMGLFVAGNWHLARLHVVEELSLATTDTSVATQELNEDARPASSPIHARTQPPAGIEALPVARHKTHWANPLAPAYWQASGWTFTEDGLTSAATGNCSTTFRQPFREVSFSTSFVPVSEPTAATTAAISKNELFQLQLVADSNEPLITMMIDSSRAMLMMSASESPPVVLREAPVVIEITRNDFRIVLTSDRLLTYLNEQVLWNVARPPVLLDQAFFVQIVTANRAVALSELRFDSGN